MQWNCQVGKQPAGSQNGWKIYEEKNYRHLHISNHGGTSGGLFPADGGKSQFQYCGRLPFQLRSEAEDQDAVERHRKETISGNCDLVL